MPNSLEIAPLELINAAHTRGPIRAAVFDFDGTLSLLRRNWQDVMIPMMIEILAATGTSETREELAKTVEEFVMRLNGKQTIFQMMRLAEEVTARGGQALEPLAYKHQYHDLLWQQVGDRVESVRSERTPAEELTVPNAAAFLTALQERGVALYLASGTDLKYVQDELQVLGLGHFFGEHVYGALDDYKQFSKAMIVERIIRDTGVQGSELLGVGDGYVEIEEVKKVGGLALGVASNEETRSGINTWKRNRLVQAGADVIVGDYRALPAILALLD
ncbi:MAG TPA: HAD family hydrolase [Pirellulaceae bacterium]|nr:HAD family hydrolase [Pirellulaceae bacterium]